MKKIKKIYQRSEEWRRKISEAHKGKPKLRLRTGVYKTCKCGEVFYVTKTKDEDLKRGKYCSRKCSYKYQRHINGISHAMRGENHWNRKENAGYKALHLRVQQERGKASVCVDCSSTKRVEWANLTGRYDDVWDYKQLCKKCHHAFDGVNKKRMKTLGKKRLTEIAKKGWETRRKTSYEANLNFLQVKGGGVL